MTVSYTHLDVYKRQYFLFPIKSIQIFLKRFFVGGVHTERCFPLFNLAKIITLDNNTEVKNVIKIPMIKVTAKPLILSLIHI